MSLWVVGCAERDRPFELRFLVEPGAVQVHNIQFYVHSVELLDASGGAHALRLRGDPPWQSDQIALIDLTENRRSIVNGTAPDRPYVAVRFSIGVPFELNHANPLIASPPLNRPDLFWAWQSGYKFLRVDLGDAGQQSSFHLGSTGCSSSSALRAPQAPCAQPNSIQIELKQFDPRTDGIQLQLKGIASALHSGFACTGDYAADADCRSAYALTGLDPATGACDGHCKHQKLFAGARVK